MLFNPKPQISVIHLWNGQPCVIVDEALRDPEALIEAARQSEFSQAPPNTFPGIWSALSHQDLIQWREYFSRTLKQHLGFRRVIDSVTRLSMVTLSASELLPAQWQCHRDQVNLDPSRILFAASVLYLFTDVSLGGTSFYRPKRSETELEAMIADSQKMAQQEFTARYGIAPQYMTESNDWFDLELYLPPVFNRLIAYNGSVFHSGHIAMPNKLCVDPARGRLTLNGFYTCTRPLGHQG